MIFSQFHVILYYQWFVSISYIHVLRIYSIAIITQASHKYLFKKKKNYFIFYPIRCISINNWIIEI